jgi:hypothetical protein
MIPLVCLTERIPETESGIELLLVGNDHATIARPTGHQPASKWMSSLGRLIPPRYCARTATR